MNEVSRDVTEERRFPWRLLVAALLALVVVVFVVQNWDDAPVEFLFFDINSRLSISLIIAMVIGALLDRVLIGLRRIRRRGD